jgi:hypothetical protein
VATSVTAFVGRAARGDAKRPQMITSFADYQRLYGGLSSFSSMGFAVRDFFLNGGSSAVILRLFNQTPLNGGETAEQAVDRSCGRLTFALTPNVKLKAANPGKWAQSLRGTISIATAASSIATAAAAALSTASVPVTATDLFDLTVQDLDTGVTEVFRNLTLIDTLNRADRVLAKQSQLVRWDTTALSLPPGATVALPQGATPAGFVGTKKDNAGAAQQQLDSDRATGKAQAKIGTDLSDLATAIQGIGGLDGIDLALTSFITGSPKTGLSALDYVDLFNILVIPPYKTGTDGTLEGSGSAVDSGVLTAAAVYCEQRRAILLVDPLPSWDADTALNFASGFDFNSTFGTNSKNAALYFPRLFQPNPFHNNQPEGFAPSGTMAGVLARTDTQRGVWKAPAGLDATLVGTSQLSFDLTDAQNGILNPLGINCLRTLPPAGSVVWGARTLQGDDRLASEWKYLPVRRTALYIEESLFRGTKWVVFEPNDEPLWSQIRLNVGAFMHNLFVQGAFQGLSPRDAYFVKCDSSTTTQNDIDQGRVNILVGFAPLKPAEFVIISLQQMAGQIQT